MGLHVLEGVQNAVHCAEQADEWSGRADSRQTRQPASKLSRLNRNGALESALTRLDLLARYFRRLLVRAKLLQTGVDDHRQMRPSVLVADVDGFFDAVVLERLRNTRREFTRLLFGLREGQVALDHDRD